MSNKRNRYPGKNANTERNKEIYDLRESGKTFREISEMFNITRDRAYKVHQVQKRNK